MDSVKKIFTLMVVATSGLCSFAQNLISDEDFKFLEQMTKDVVESSRVKSGDKARDVVNNLGGTIIRPGGRDCYPSYWVRDYAMSVASGFITKEEQKFHLMITAKTQCDHSWITKNGSLIPAGAITDHIRLNDALPVYYPGTYSYTEQGTTEWGKMPPVGDHFHFINMAYLYYKSTNSADFLNEKINGTKLINRLELAYNVPTTPHNSHVIYTTANFRCVDHGFRDSIHITGHLCFSTLLKYRASYELAELLELVGEKEKAQKYRKIGESIKADVPKIFMGEKGMLKASTGMGALYDVWSTAVAVYFNVLEGDVAKKACKILADAYKNGTLCQRGNPRHIIKGDDFSKDSMWEKANSGNNVYQNGAYWGTPVGWVAYAIAQVDVASARKMVAEYIAELRENDYRKGENFNSPIECFNLDNGHSQNPVYMTTVTSPYIVFRNLRK